MKIRVLLALGVLLTTVFGIQSAAPRIPEVKHSISCMKMDEVLVYCSMYFTMGFTGGTYPILLLLVPNLVEHDSYCYDKKTQCLLAACLATGITAGAFLQGLLLTHGVYKSCSKLHA